MDVRVAILQAKSLNMVGHISYPTLGLFWKTDDW